MPVVVAVAALLLVLETWVEMDADLEKARLSPPVLSLVSLEELGVKDGDARRWGIRAVCPTATSPKTVKATFILMEVYLGKEAFAMTARCTIISKGLL